MHVTVLTTHGLIRSKYGYIISIIGAYIIIWEMKIILNPFLYSLIIGHFFPIFAIHMMLYKLIYIA